MSLIKRLQKLWKLSEVGLYDQEAPSAITQSPNIATVFNPKVTPKRTVRIIKRTPVDPIDEIVNSK